MSPLPPTPTDTKAGWLDRPLPIFLRVLLILLCAQLPTAFVVREYQKRHDLTQLIYFGQNRMERSLPEIKALNPAANSPSGYDGQYYAQIALDPTLRRPDLANAVDLPVFRMERIALPMLAHVLGGGSPEAILRVYALLNLFFWYVLFAALLWWVRAASPRSFLAVFAIVLTTGALISIQRALTDLPAATFGFLSLYLTEIPAALMISLAILTKPTSGLFLMRYLLPLPKTLGECMRRSGAILLALILPGLWLFYLFHLFHDQRTSGDNLTVPFLDWSRQLAIAWKNLGSLPIDFQWMAITQWEWNLFEFLALTSMALQAAFLLLQPRWRHPIWIMGIGFAVLFFCLNHNCFAEQIAYSRTVLPLTIAFNLLLLEFKRGPIFVLYFVMGNVGLMLSVKDMLGSWLRG